MNKGIEIIKHFEGCKLKAYLCPAKVWTIGYGSTFYEDGSKVKEGDTITQQRADEFLSVMVAKFKFGVKAVVTSQVNENQIGALTSFAFNVGVGALKSSTLLKVVNQNPNSPDVGIQFAKWTKAGGKVLNGLVRRREAETKLYYS